MTVVVTSALLVVRLWAAGGDGGRGGWTAGGRGCGGTDAVAEGTDTVASTASMLLLAVAMAPVAV